MSPVGNIITPDVSKVYNILTTHLNRELPATPGTVHYSADGSKAYRFVRADFAVAIGDLCCFSTTGDSDRAGVSPDNGGATCVLTLAAGLGLSVIAATEFGWIQVKGLNDVAVVTDGGLVQGENIIAHATTNGGAESGTAAEQEAAVFGQALQTDTGTVLAAGEIMLECPTDSVDAIS